MRTFAILHFLDGMIIALIDDLLFVHYGIGDIVNESPADASAAACVDESVLWTSIESILAIDKFRVEHHIALL